MDKKKKEKTLKQIKSHRAARRQIEIDLQTPKESAKIWLTSKKDQADKESNDIKVWEDAD